MTNLNTAVTQDAIANAGNFLADICHEAAAKWWIDLSTGEDVRNWPKPQQTLWIMSKLALVHTEVSEAVEGVRKDLPDDKLPQYGMFECELADTVIRCFDLAGGFNLNLGRVIAEKLAFNAQRADHKIENRLAAGGKSV